MKNYCALFRGKKVTVMGLGLLGRGVGDVKFLADCGAKLIVTDLKTEKELAPSLQKLQTADCHQQSITYHLGGHRLADFRDRDFILKAAGVPFDSPYLAEARRNGIPIKMSTALFAKLAAERGVKIIGVTGTRGKSTVVQLIYEMLKISLNQGPSFRRKKVLLGGNVRGVSTLALLKEAKSGDIAVLELDSWQLQGFGEERISPHIAVFTNFMPDHLNYYRGRMRWYWRDKENIFRYQRAGDYLVLGPKIKIQKSKVKSIVQKPKVLPGSWQIRLLGKHNRQNAILAAETARIVGVPSALIRRVIQDFRGLPGRLELVRVWRGIRIYNDTNATTPEATIAALHALKSKKIILVGGGADKGLVVSGLVKTIPGYCKALVLLPGSGTEKLKSRIENSKVKILAQEAKDLSEAVRLALASSDRGDIVLFSPGFASFGLFKNEYDRGDRFVEIIRKLK